MAQFGSQFTPQAADPSLYRWDLNGVNSGLENLFKARDNSAAARALADGDVAGAIRASRDPQFGLQQRKDARKQQAFDLDHQKALAQRFGSTVENGVLNNPDDAQAQAVWDRLRQHPQFSKMIPPGQSLGNFRDDARSVLGMAQGYIGQADRIKMAAEAAKIVEPYNQRIADLEKMYLLDGADKGMLDQRRAQLVAERDRVMQQYGIAPPGASPGAPARQPQPAPSAPPPGAMGQAIGGAAGVAAGGTAAGPVAPFSPAQNVPGPAPALPPSPVSPQGGQPGSQATTAPLSAYPPAPAGYQQGGDPTVRAGNPNAAPSTQTVRPYSTREDDQLLLRHMIFDPSGKFRTAFEGMPGHKARVEGAIAREKLAVQEEERRKNAQERVLPVIEDFKHMAMKYGANTLEKAIGPYMGEQKYQAWASLVPGLSKDAYNLNVEMHHAVDLIASQIKGLEGGKGGGTDADAIMLKDALGAALKAKDVNTFFSVLHLAENRFRGIAGMPRKPMPQDANPHTQFVPPQWRTDGGGGAPAAPAAHGATSAAPQAQITPQPGQSYKWTPDAGLQPTNARAHEVAMMRSERTRGEDQRRTDPAAAHVAKVREADAVNEQRSKLNPARWLHNLTREREDVVPQ